MTATHNNLYAIQGLFNAASSALYINGTLNSAGASIGTGAFGTSAGQLCLGYGGTVALTGHLFEVGVWNANKTANNATVNSNQRTYWNF